MLDELKKQFGSVKILVALLTIAVAIYLFQVAWQVLGLFSDAIIILFSAWVISCILEPSVNKLSQFTKLSRGYAAGIIYVIFFSLVVISIMLFIPAISTQFQMLLKILPKYLSYSPEFVSKLSSTGLSYLEGSLPILPSIAGFMFYLFLVLIISFYLIVDKDRFEKELYNLMPKSWHEHARFTQDLIDTTFGSFIRVQLLFGLIAGVATWIVLRIIGVDFAASTAIIAGALTTIPLVGPVLGIIPPVAIAFFGDPTKGIIVFLALFIFQQILFNIIGPRLLGKAFKMHPIIVLLSFIVGYRIFGPLGAIFAVPVLGILLVIIHRLGLHFITGEK